MPDNVKSYILEKNNEIKTGENNYKLQMAINGLMQFPWKPKDPNSHYMQIKNSMTKSRNYLQNVAKKLNETVYGHENSKKVLIELVGKWIQNPESTGQVIGLVGPPGVGKTLLAKGISSALGIPLSIVGLGGMSDSADLIGHSFTYAGAQYGMIVRQMIKAGNWRCVMFFDEVDKVSKRNDTNEIYNTLIHITDPNMNQNFQDRFYSSSIDFDLSGVLVVFSYNNSEKLDPILLDRIKEIKISAYSVKEKISIAQNYILKELCENIGFDREKIQINDDIIQYIIEKYTMEAGVRELKRQLEQILLKINIDRFYMRGPFRKLLKAKYLQEKIEEQEIISEKSPDHTDISYFIDHKKIKWKI
nr:AAA family ATPase [Mimivirus sp.]